MADKALSRADSGFRGAGARPSSASSGGGKRVAPSSGPIGAAGAPWAAAPTTVSMTSKSIGSGGGARSRPSSAPLGGRASRSIGVRPASSSRLSIIRHARAADKKEPWADEEQRLRQRMKHCNMSMRDALLAEMREKRKVTQKESERMKERLKREEETAARRLAKAQGLSGSGQVAEAYEDRHQGTVTAMRASRARPVHLSAMDPFVEYPWKGAPLLFPTTGWQGATRNHNKPPASELELEFVYGYQGRDGQDNVFWTGKGDEIVYYVAAVCIVYSPKTHKQRFFFGHDDDVSTICLHPDGRIAASAQVGKVATICIWDTKSLECYVRLSGHQRYVGSLGFSPGLGNKLVSTGGDDQHSIGVWYFPTVDTASGPKIVWHEGKLQFGFAPCHGAQVKACRFNQYNASGHIVAVGDKLAKFVDGMSYTANNGSYGKLAEPQMINCVTFSNITHVLTGQKDGSIYKWAGGCVVSVIDKAHNGQVTALHYVRSSDFGGLLSGGSNGFLCLWDIDNDNRLLGRFDLRKFAAKGLKDSMAIKSIDSLSRYPTARDNGLIVIGTSTNCIILFNLQKRMAKVLMHSHCGSLRGLACHSKPLEQLVATTSEDKTLRVWDVRSRRMRTCEFIGSEGSALAISPDGTKYAVGHKDGKFSVWQTSGLGVLCNLPEEKKIDPYTWQPMEDLSKLKPGQQPAAGAASNALIEVGVTPNLLVLNSFRTEEIEDLKFSPDEEGRYLAVTSHDNYCDLYDTSKVVRTAPSKPRDPWGFNYRRTGTCTGHSSFLTHVDFSADGSLLQTTCGAGELLYWQVPTGKQNPKSGDAKDIQWNTQTAIFGWAIKSIWPEGSDKTDINAVCRSYGAGGNVASGDVLVTAGDNGLVTLFPYPAVGDKQKAKQYHGHSSHVTNVRFTRDDAYVLSVGGNDMAIFQWRHAYPEEIDSQPVGVSEELGSDQQATDMRMTTADVLEKLDQWKLSQYKELFSAAKITGRELLALSDSSLQTLGVQKDVDRSRMLRRIKSMVPGK